jgi:hypothetical protein
LENCVNADGRPTVLVKIRHWRVLCLAGGAIPEGTRVRVKVPLDPNAGPWPLAPLQARRRHQARRQLIW